MRNKALAVLALALSSCLSPGPPAGVAKPSSEGKVASASSEDRVFLLERLKALRAAAGTDEPGTMPNVDRIVDRAIADIVKGKRKADAIIDVALRDAAQNAGRDCKAWSLTADSLSEMPMPHELVSWPRALVSFGVAKSVDGSGKPRYLVLIFAPDPSVQRGGYEVHY